tara:strand:- start:2086 stop:2973 length:888 start_codon:yes stop_codon:yes gene_type:complete
VRIDKVFIIFISFFFCTVSHAVDLSDFEVITGFSFLNKLESYSLKMKNQYQKLIDNSTDTSNRENQLDLRNKFESYSFYLQSLKQKLQKESSKYDSFSQDELVLKIEEKLKNFINEKIEGTHFVFETALLLELRSRIDPEKLKQLNALVHVKKDSLVSHSYYANRINGIALISVFEITSLLSLIGAVFSSTQSGVVFFSLMFLMGQTLTAVLFLAMSDLNSKTAGIVHEIEATKDHIRVLQEALPEKSQTVDQAFILNQVNQLLLSLNKKFSGEFCEENFLKLFQIQTPFRRSLL